MALATSSASLAEIGIGLGLGGLFTEAELAAADQLVQLSGGGGDEAPSSSSPRSVNTCTGTAAWEGEGKTAIGGLGVELDRRARKRCRLLSELYAATRPMAGAAASTRKRKRHGEPEAEAPMMMRYGDQCY
ncbi:uncharacterized protein LOC133902027 [Phragmites australis]|uniref:uncharacterized protein LOC133902027 n=1 Tax=Phragmites australis TaxID=29695 RepID=UPI002D779841|nr:uncharacterized protein LOC133902027 [Phragmites australis]